jgi:1,3,6,8-tetrahydroxynaphthalene synthase
MFMVRLMKSQDVIGACLTAAALAAAKLARSRATLTEHGNIASATVLDALRRQFEADDLRPGARGILAGMGPGITVGTWTVS